MPEPGNLSKDILFNRVANVLGCKWTLAIIDGIARGINRPGRLERELPGLTTKVLNERIAKLERFGLLVRDTYDERPPRVEYRFTPDGRRMVDLMVQVRKYVEDWEGAK